MHQHVASGVAFGDDIREGRHAKQAHKQKRGHRDSSGSAQHDVHGRSPDVKLAPLDLAFPEPGLNECCSVRVIHFLLRKQSKLRPPAAP
jgi:hypothetical protein